jgi:Fe-S cluster biogenesis protein NfuA
MGWLDPILGKLRGRDSAPEEPATGDPARVEATQRVLDGMRGFIEADGGAVRLVCVDGGRVTVRFSGACTSCSAIDMTVQQALEPSLRAALPWFEELRME